MKPILLIACISLLNFTTSGQSSPLQVETLKCESIIDPIAIDNRHPKLSWTFLASSRNQFQSAYEILVSDTKAKAEKLDGNFWTTGKIQSAQNLHIHYQGKLLSSFTRYYWRVRVFNKEGGVSDWSKTAWFETAFLDSTDWTANWIDNGSLQPASDEDYYKNDPMPLFRKEFVAKKIFLQQSCTSQGLDIMRLISMVGKSGIMNSILGLQPTENRCCIVFMILPPI